MFDTATIHETRPLGIIKTALRILVGAYFVIGLTAGYRAYYQIQGLELEPTEKVLRVGSSINRRLVSYARVPITVKLELVQGGTPKNSQPRSYDANQ